MKGSNVEFIIRYSRLPDEQRSLTVRSADAVTRIVTADWVAISHSVMTCDDPRAPTQLFNVCFMADDGSCVLFASFDALDVAMNRVRQVAGVAHDKWRPCHVETRSDGVGVRWIDVV